MKTLVELYDDCPIENVLAADTFRPERTVYLCPSEIAQDKEKQKRLQEYFRHRGMDMETVFLDTSLFHTDKVIRQLQRVAETYPDCAIDIAGGSDAALFAAGYFCRETDIPVFTHSRKKQKFFAINNADFAHHLPFSVQYSVQDFFLMAYGDVKPGRVTNDALVNREDMVDRFFTIFMKYRKKWNHIVTWFQRASQSEKDGEISLSVHSDYYVKGERGSRIPANKEALKDFERIGFLTDLMFEDDTTVSFRFRDTWVRYWLRDQGSVLEIYVWKACRDAGIFYDVTCSTVVEWEKGNNGEKVTNEIDVMAVKATSIPVFISCKTCTIDTDAINELAILRDRFGGNAAKAFIISTENCRAITRRRADALDIDVITLNDIRSCRLTEQIRSLAQ